MEEEVQGHQGPFKTSPTRPWQCQTCGWYMAIPKSAGCPYCLSQEETEDKCVKEKEDNELEKGQDERRISESVARLPPKRRDKDRDIHPASLKTREQDLVGAYMECWTVKK